MTYPGGSGRPIQTDTSVRQPKRIERAVKPFKPILRKITRRGKA